ncbi:hypothetical protein [Amycolatopsis taiwanensis]|uniref:hypothetical protein n=1 Tax=Amycolatopsis taiwanensis TaxID=342230 RepID=UPI0004807613|nr:hypothetical protein [Amycolatopsis taiwanensis]
MNEVIQFQPQQRVFQAGDPEPSDVARVRDNEGDVWERIEPMAWQVAGEDPDYAVSWQSLAPYAPLTEVRS